MQVQLRSQLEYILSDENYHKCARQALSGGPRATPHSLFAVPTGPHASRASRDVHLQLLQENDGFTPLQLVVSTYQTVQALVKHVDSSQAWLQPVCEALTSSSELVLRSTAALADATNNQPAAVRRMTLPEKICSQVEWYLDPDRMAADRFLVEQARPSAGGAAW